MPLKESMSTKDTFAILDVKKMTADVCVWRGVGQCDRGKRGRGSGKIMVAYLSYF